MTFFMSLENFRAFKCATDVKIAPITILTGMNSSGKSSFLGALRFISDIKSPTPSGSSVNKATQYDKPALLYLGSRKSDLFQLSAPKLRRTGDR
jgi:AAA15 family ATPase/GTPase